MVRSGPRYGAISEREPTTSSLTITSYVVNFYDTGTLALLRTFRYFVDVLQNLVADIIILK